MSSPLWKDLLARRHVSPGQGILVVHVSQRIGAVMAALAFRLGLSPNTVTLLGLAVMLAGCMPYVSDAPSGWLTAALLWQLGFALDCADGQLARATGRGSAYGAWLDVSCDHMRQSALAISVFAATAPAIGVLPAALASFAFAAGLSTYLQTATLMHVLKPPEFRAPAWMSALRTLVHSALDTPVLLLALCLLRPWPLLLALFAGAYGVLLLVRAAAIGRSRLST